MDERRKSYNQAQAEIRRAERERIRTFREQNPERFAEMLAQVQTEESVPTRRMSAQEAITKRAASESQNRINEIIRQTHKGKRDYILQAKDEYGEEHTLFFGFPISYVPKPGDIIKTPIKEVVYVITSVEPCTCPLCQ